MAVKRKLENETEEQRISRVAREAIANHATRSEKTSWGRKRLNLEKMVLKDIRPKEDRIMEMQMELKPLYDAVAEMRTDMVESCIHPFDHLVYNEDTSVFCKFCNKKLQQVSNNE
jgi:hypothetical protein